jgi:hypothetical protein
VVHSLSPGLVLGILFTLVGAQVTRLVAPGRGGYAWTVLLAAGGVVAGEMVASALNLAGPPLGSLHPVPDAAGIAVLEAIGALLVSPRRDSGAA